MEKELEVVLSDLTDIQISLRKLGPNKRLFYKDKVSEKILKAKELYCLYENIISIFSEQKCTLELAEYVIDILKDKIELVYKKILSYEISSSEPKSLKMEQFDIKTATSLIPDL